MSNTYKKLDVDYTVVIDPGYATQGIFIYACGPQVPQPICSRSTLTNNDFGIWERIAFQFEQINVLLNWLGTTNVMLVLEEYHAAGKTSHRATYFRAFYDALFRERMISRFRHAVTINPKIVYSMSRVMVQGEKKKVPHEVFDGSVEGVLKYMGHLYPDVFHPSILTLDSEFHQVVSQKGKPPARTAKNTWVAHCADAGMMGMIGLSAFVYEGFLDRLDADQQEKIKELREAYTFAEEARRTYR